MRADLEREQAARPPEVRLGCCRDALTQWASERHSAAQMLRVELRTEAARDDPLAVAFVPVLAAPLVAGQTRARTEPIPCIRYSGFGVRHGRLVRPARSGDEHSSQHADVAPRRSAILGKRAEHETLARPGGSYTLPLPMSDANSARAASAPADPKGDPPRWSCPACGAAATHRYCAACGERRLAKADLSVLALLSQVAESIIDVDGRVFRTFWALVLRPGELTLAYAEGRRKPYIAPFQLFLIANVAFFFLQSALG